ncbi:archease, partial [Candidatus Woesearchaeota archaeon]|nr:archease [Candidatus Woesearchaeota archaeon]
FENSAKALFSIICEIEQLEPTKSFWLEIEAESHEELLYEWLSRLLAESEIRGLFFSRFVVSIEGNKLKARVYGSKADPKIGKVQVKAITKYKFGLVKQNSLYVATVSCDI